MYIGSQNDFEAHHSLNNGKKILALNMSDDSTVHRHPVHKSRNPLLIKNHHEKTMQAQQNLKNFSVIFAHWTQTEIELELKSAAFSLSMV